MYVVKVAQHSEVELDRRKCMKYCSNCGAELSANAKYCKQCGSEVSQESPAGDSYVQKKPETNQEKQRNMNEQRTAFVDSAKDVSEKAKDAVMGFAAGVQTKVDKELEKQKALRDAEKARQNQLEEERKRKEEDAKKWIQGTAVINRSEMWSWLKKTASRKHYYTEEVNPLTINEFVTKVQNKLEENKVPAVIEQRAIEWDRSGLKDEIYAIKPLTNAANPLSCLLQFNHVGKFSFVEEKTFITPPDLPKVPEERKELNSKLKERMKLMIFGIVLGIAGIFFLKTSLEIGLTIIFVSVVLTGIGYTAFAEIKQVEEHNEMVRLQELAWEKAWTDWQNKIFLHSFQEDINGQVSRIFEAAFECIDMVCNEEFKKEPELVEKEVVDLNNLEEMIARRKKDYR